MVGSSGTVMRWLGLAALLVGLGAAVPQAQAETVLKVSANTPVRSMDPAKFSLGAIEYNFSLLVYNRLTFFDDKLNVIPDLATSWDSSPDLKTWTFHLRHGVKFHTGREVDSDDVATTYKRLQDPANASVIRGSLGIVTSIETPDKYTVRFNLSAPYASFPAVTASFQAAILPKDQLDVITTKEIGSGPYKFVSYDPNGAMELARNPDYFDKGAYKFDRIEFKMMPDFSTQVAALQQGELDIAWGLPPEYVDQVKKMKGAHVAEVPTGTWAMFGINESAAPLDNPKVRQAIFKLIDKKKIADVALFGHGTPTNTPLPPFHPFYDKAIPIQKADPAAAKKLLAEAGYPNGLTIQLWMPAQQPILERMAVTLRDTAKAAGLTIEIHPVPEDQFRPSSRPFMINNFSARTTPDTILYDWYTTKGSWNSANWHYSNPEIDKLLDQARQTANVEEQKKLYTRFQEIAANDGPGAVVFVVNHADGVSNKLQGFKASPLTILNLKGVSLGIEVGLRLVAPCWSMC